MEDDNDNSKTYLAVVPVASLPTQMPVAAAALGQVLKLFGHDMQVICVTLTARSYWWLGSKSESESSRGLAQEAEVGGYAGVLLLFEAGNSTLPAGLMCWLECFPDMARNQANITQLLPCLLHPREKHWLLRINGSETFTAFHARLWKDVLNTLAHDQKNYDGTPKEAIA